MTTHNQTDHTEQPVIFHLGRDPGEKYQLKYVPESSKNRFNSIV